MRRMPILVLVILLAWVALGPVGMAFSECAGYCEGPCGVLAYTPEIAPRLLRPDPVAYLDVISAEFAPARDSAALDPPPKTFSLA